MSVAVKKRPAVKVDEADKTAMANADIFVRAARERSAAEKEYEHAKAALKVWLDGDVSRALPDGRTVSFVVTPRDGYTVAAGTTGKMTVSPAPAA